MALTRKTTMARGTSTLKRTPFNKAPAKPSMKSFVSRPERRPPPLPDRPKRSRRKAHTAGESAYLGAVAALGCCICRMQGLHSAAEVHHQRTGTGGGRRASHYRTIGLCPPHHRLGGIGVAYHAGPETWEAIHGTEVSHVEETRLALAHLLPPEEP